MGRNNRGKSPRANGNGKSKARSKSNTPSSTATAIATATAAAATATTDKSDEDATCRINDGTRSETDEKKEDNSSSSASASASTSASARASACASTKSVAAHGRPTGGADVFTPPWTSISFSCGGWLQFYLFGVARAFQATGLHKGVQLAGCSAGALAAAGLALDGDFDGAVEFCKTDCIPKAYSTVSGLFVLHEYVAASFDGHLGPHYSKEKLPPGRLQVAITQFPSGAATRVTEHDSSDDLKNSLLASAAAWPVAKIHEHPKYGTTIDGGLSDFQPLCDENTITVSPFYFSDCDIRPSRYIPPWWAVVPPRSTDTVDWCYDLGFQDAMKFIKKKEIAASPHARSHLAEPYIRKDAHPFDSPRKFTMHRFLGYRYSGVISNLANFCMDFGLGLCFVLLLKPLALVLIYLELFIRGVVAVAWLLTAEILLLFVPLVLFTFGIFDGAVSLDQSMKPTAVASFEQSLQRFHAETRDIRMRRITDKFLCICSLSLLLRFLPGTFNRPSNRYLRKHDRLYRHSYLYRIVRHVI